MRLLIVSPYWTYPEVAIEFLTRIAERGHSIIAIKACNEPKSVVFYKVGNVIIYEIQNLSISAKVLGQKRYPYFLNFNEILKKLDYDVMIVQLPLFLTSLQALRMGRKMKKPVILEVHGIYADRGFVLNLAQKAYLRVVGKWIFGKTSLIRCLTQQDARDLIRFGASPEKIRIIPNAVDTEKF